MEQLERFKRIYGWLGFHCRMSNCRRAYKLYRTEQERLDHERTHSRVYTCSYCNSAPNGFKLMSGLRKHEEKYHMKLEDFKLPDSLKPKSPPKPRAQSPMPPVGSSSALQDWQMQQMLLEQQNMKRVLMSREEQETTAKNKATVFSNLGVSDQDYSMQLMLLEQQRKKRPLMARQEQDMPTGPSASLTQDYDQGPVLLEQENLRQSQKAGDEREVHDRNEITSPSNLYNTDYWFELDRQKRIQLEQARDPRDEDYESVSPALMDPIQMDKSSGESESGNAGHWSPSQATSRSYLSSAESPPAEFWLPFQEVHGYAANPYVRRDVSHPEETVHPSVTYEELPKPYYPPNLREQPWYDENYTQL
ncbi:MAG: hypothetical protein Q9195_005385 [Heterodermia aff. obscurata]